MRYRPHRSSVVITAASMLVIAAAAPMVGLGPSAWRPVFELDDSSQGAMRKVEQLVGFARDVALHRRLDAQATQLLAEVRSNLTTLDVGELYELLEDRGTGREQRRDLLLQGSVSAGDGYRVSVPRQPTAPRDFGDMRARLTLRPARPSVHDPENENYVVGWQGVARLNNLRIEHLAGFATESLRFFAAHAQRHGAAPTDAEATKQLDATDADCLAALSRALPETYRFAARYLDARDVVAHTSVAGTRLQLRARLNFERIARDFPHTGEMLEGARGIFDTEIRFIDPQQRLLGSLEFDSQLGEITYSLHTIDGQLVPVNPDGRPAIEDAINFKTVMSVDYAMVVETRTNVTGIQTRMTDLRYDIAYRRDARSAGWHVSLTQPPRFSAWGAAFGIVPLWVMDAMIPSDVEAITNAFLHTLARGNDGRGLWALLAIPSSAQGRDLRAEFEGELMSNGFVSFVLSIAAWKVFPDDDARAEIEVLKQNYFKALVADVQRARADLEAAQAREVRGESREMLRSPMR